MFGLSNAQLGGVRYRILTGATSYLLEVTFPSDQALPQTYSVCLEPEMGSVTCSGNPVVQPGLPSATLFIPPPLLPQQRSIRTARASHSQQAQRRLMSAAVPAGALVWWRSSCWAAAHR